MRAVSLQKRVCVVEAGRVGGADVWNGTVQSKTLWEMGQFVSKLTSSDFTGRLMDPAAAAQVATTAVDDNRIRDTLQRVSAQMEQQRMDVMKASGVELIRGKATFSGEHEVDVHTEGSGEYRELSADYFIIATGSKPRGHPLYPTDHRRVLTSDDMFNLPQVPRSLVIIGGGPMGCEFASCYARLGKTKVALVDKAPRILPKEDEDVAKRVEAQLERRGVRLHHHSHLFDLEPFEKPDRSGEGGCYYTVQKVLGGELQTFKAERALVVIGRVPNYDGLGLEQTKMRVQNGQLVVDEYNRCRPYEHIYCVGDACNDRKTVSLAQAAARAAVHAIFTSKPRYPVNSRVIRNFSTDVFLDEEVAGIGLNEQQCRERGISYLATSYDYAFMTRTAMMAETNGFVKLLVTNDREKQVLGVRAVGPHSGSVVEAVSLAIRNEASVYSLLKLNPAYPSVVQGLVECARLTVGRGSMMHYGKGIEVREWTAPC